MTDNAPRGWTTERVKSVADYYDSQTEDEEAAEFEAAWTARGSTMIQVPRELVPAVQELLAEFERKKSR